MYYPNTIRKECIIPMTTKQEKTTIQKKEWELQFLTLQILQYVLMHTDITQLVDLHPLFKSFFLKLASNRQVPFSFLKDKNC